MLGTLITNWTEGIGSRWRHPHLMTATQFNREVACERIRATRRSIPFCLLTIELNAATHRRRRNRVLARVLERHTRLTDRKAQIGSGKFGLLLVDTPERGGRAAMKRLQEIAAARGLEISIQLRVHDPAGLDDDPPSGHQDRNGDRVPVGWARRESDSLDSDVGADVEVSAEDPLVSRPFLRMSIKRTVDITGAIVGLVLTSPLMLLAMAAIRMTDSGPALYKQTREGLRGKPFKIYKLRTMVVDAEHAQSELRHQSHRDGPAFKIESDPRVTRVGNFLRKTCIDELPQLVNVLKGEMSLVGPRPLPWHESRACDDWHRRRLDVRPGLTCDWQVNKSRAKTFDDWMRLDLRYVDEISFLRDIRLIVQTIAVPILARGGQ